MADNRVAGPFCPPYPTMVPSSGLHVVDIALKNGVGTAGTRSFPLPSSHDLNRGADFDPFEKPFRRIVAIQRHTDAPMRGRMTGYGGEPVNEDIPCDLHTVGHRRILEQF